MSVVVKRGLIVFLFFAFVLSLGGGVGSGGDKCEITNKKLKVLKRYNDSVEVSWKADVENTTDENMETLYVVAEFKDSEGFKIAESLTTMRLKPREKATVSETTILDDSIYNQVDHFMVTTYMVHLQE